MAGAVAAKNTADTPVTGPNGYGSSSPGYLTRGIEDPYRHYCQRLITDAVRALDTSPAPVSGPAPPSPHCGRGLR